MPCVTRGKRQLAVLTHALCCLAQVAQASCGSAQARHTAGSRARALKSPATLVGPDNANATAGLLLLAGGDAYATYDLPVTGIAHHRVRGSDVVRVDRPAGLRSGPFAYTWVSHLIVEDIGRVNGTA